MRRVIALGIAISVVMVLFFAACAAPETTPTTSTPTPTSPTPTVTATPAETLSELLEQAAGITSVKYDQVITTLQEPRESVQMKVWLKGNKMRVEMTYQEQDAVAIIDKDAQVAYLYVPSQNMASKTDLQGQGTMSVNFLPATEWSKSILASSKSAVVATETIDGKDCLVVENTEDQAGKMKMWIWKEYGLPIRMEVMDNAIFEWKNMEVVSIPDSMFELPAGVQIQEQ
jgi:outer membrane lipoprotein-sorting protein